MQITEYTKKPVKKEKKGKTLYKCRIWYYKNGARKSKCKQGFVRKKDASDWGIDEKRKLERLQEDSGKLTVGDNSKLLSSYWSKSALPVKSAFDVRA